MPVKDDAGLPIVPVTPAGPLMDARESRKEGTTEAVCQSCGGTGSWFLYRSETDRRYDGPCIACFGTGRVAMDDSASNK